MSQSAQEKALNQRLQVMQMMIGALALGATVFTVIVIVVRGQGVQQVPDTPLITYCAFVFAMPVLFANFFVPGAVAATARRALVHAPEAAAASADLPGDAGKLCEIFQTQMLIGASLLEGATFFFLIAFFVEGQPLSLVGGLMFLIGLALKFPTRARLERWLEEQQELLQAERAAG